MAVDGRIFVRMRDAVAGWGRAPALAWCMHSPCERVLSLDFSSGDDGRWLALCGWKGDVALYACRPMSARACLVSVDAVRRGSGGSCNGGGRAARSGRGAATRCRTHCVHVCLIVFALARFGPFGARHILGVPARWTGGTLTDGGVRALIREHGHADENARDHDRSQRTRGPAPHSASTNTHSSIMVHAVKHVHVLVFENMLHERAQNTFVC